MADLRVRIVQLPALRVASVRGFGPSPEQSARDKLSAWARKAGALDDAQEHRVFGFNNPNPTSVSPDYGYELWITVGPQVEPGPGVSIKLFLGGRYAVTRCQGAQNIEATWEELRIGVEKSVYTYSPHQWLEEHLAALAVPLTPEALMLDLFFPIQEECD